MGDLSDFHRRSLTVSIPVGAIDGSRPTLSPEAESQVSIPVGAIDG